MLQTNDSNMSTSRLLALPPELRETIFGFALIESTSITINHSNHEEPSLLRTSRLTRREASPIYYQNNTFLLDADNFDPSIVVAFHRQACQYLKGDGNLRFNVGRARSWRNLRLWLKAYYEGKAFRLRRYEVDDVNEVLASQAFDVVDELADLAWERIERVLSLYGNATGRALRLIT